MGHFYLQKDKVIDPANHDLIREGLFLSAIKYDSGIYHYQYFM